MPDTTTSDPYAEVAALVADALTAFKAKLETFVADVATIADPLGTGVPNTPARTFFAAQQMNLGSLLTMALPSVMAQSGVSDTPPTS